MVDWLEKDPRAAAARAANEKLLRSQEDRNIGEITLPPHLREVKDRIDQERRRCIRERGPRRRRRAT